MARKYRATEETTAEILGVSETIFRDKGYAKTTIAEIAQACQMSPANIYRVFLNKQDIAEAILKRHFDEFLQQADSFWGQAGPLSTRLPSFISEYMDFFDADRDPFLFEMLRMASLEQWGVWEHIIDTVRTALRMAMQSMPGPRYRSNEEVAELTDALFRIILPFLHPILLENEHRPSLKREHGIIFRMLEGALCNQSQRAPAPGLRVTL